jgi:hypothetical protein
LTFSLRVCVSGNILAGTIAILSSRALRSASGGWGSVHAASALYYHRKPYKINLPKGDSLEGQYKRSCVFAPLRSYGKAS